MKRIVVTEDTKKSATQKPSPILRTRSIPPASPMKLVAKKVQSPTEERPKPSKKTGVVKGFFLVLILLICMGASSLFGALVGFRLSLEEHSFLSDVALFSFVKTPIQKKSDGGSDVIDLVNVPATMIEEEQLTIEMVERVSPAIVSIAVSKNISAYHSFEQDPFEFFGFPFSPYDQYSESPSREREIEIGGGSGFFVSEDGMIITNKHVVDDPRAKYTVILADGNEHVADVLAIDPNRDVALLQIEGNNYPTLPLGDSENIRVGQTVIAIGNSLGEFDNSVSRGIVSGLKRNIVAGSGAGNSERLTNIIQTDAAINPGNSGGPLLNLSGEVIGINTAIAQNAENVGFALPINPMKQTIAQVKDGGKISVPFLGVRSIQITKEIQQANNLPYSYGALVIRGQNVAELAVLPGSPADKANIVENDILLEINGEKIEEKNRLSDILSKYTIGDTLKVKVWHKGEEKEVSAVLEERKEF